MRTMDKRIQGFAFHCHHDVLGEWVTDYAERVAYIKAHKPAEEQELRLRLFRMVPLDRLPAPFIKAKAASDKAWTVCDKAEVAYDKARATYDKARATYDKAKAASDKAWTVCDKAEVAYDKARATYDKAWTVCAKAWTVCDKAAVAYDKAWVVYDTDMQALHAELCSDCPWDGETIFPARKE